jgi:hypothetical protein
MKQKLTILTRILFWFEYQFDSKYIPESDEFIPNKFFYWRFEDFVIVRKCQIIDDEQGAWASLYMTSDEIANYIV